jgi:hypothetical protein
MALRFVREVTPLNCDGQFKPFVYLNPAGPKCGTARAKNTVIVSDSEAIQFLPQS